VEAAHARAHRAAQRDARLLVEADPGPRHAALRGLARVGLAQPDHVAIEDDRVGPHRAHAVVLDHVDVAIVHPPLVLVVRGAHAMPVAARLEVPDDVTEEGLRQLHARHARLGLQRRDRAANETEAQDRLGAGRGGGRVGHGGDGGAACADLAR
jgi:hypothetical protein